MISITMPEDKDNLKKTSPGKTTDRIPRREIIIGIISIIITIGLGVTAIIFKDTLMAEARTAGYGLIAVVIVSFLAGSILSFVTVPIPYWFLVVTLPAALAIRWGIFAPVFVALSSALGTTVGHMPTFMIGYGGRSISRKLTNRFSNNWYGRWYHKVIRWSAKHGWIAVFLNSALFNPVHLPMDIAFGTLRYPPWKYFVYSYMGNFVKSSLLAFAGFYGLGSLLRILGLQ